MNGTPARRRVELYPKELEALRLAANGFTAAQAAERLCVTPAAVNDALRRARVALRASNTTHAAVLALAGGYLSRGEIRDIDHAWKEGGR